MAKRRKSSQNSTPSSNTAPEPDSEPVSQPESEPEPEPPSQPEPEPEPIEEEPQPIVEEQEEEEEEEATEAAKLNEDEGGAEEDEPQEVEQEQEQEQEPQTLENPIPSSDPAASNGGGGNAGEDLQDLDPQSIHKIIEVFPKEQLVDLLRDAAVKHPDVLEEVRRIADVDPALRKIFVHGLGWDSNAQSLTEFFSQFGEVEDCNAVTDKITGKSKGYAFILFKHRSGAENVLKEPQKKIRGRMVACQLASVGPVGPVPPLAPPVSEYTQRKIFVSNVGAEVDTQKLLQFFAQYGEIEEGPMGLDKVTGKPRGFCLFVYKAVESAKKALEEPHKNFEGHVLHCQKAVDGQKGNSKQGFSSQRWAGNQFGGGPKGQKRKFNSGGAGGHLMAPSANGPGYNQAAMGPSNPAVNQAALTALLATQGVGGLANLLGGLGPAGGPVMNQGMPQGGYGGGYGGQAPVQGGYGGTQMGQGGGPRGPQGYGGPPYMGHH